MPNQASEPENMKSNLKANGQRIRINTVIIGEPAIWLSKWKQRGLITSYTDAIIQALKLFNEKQVEQDLKKEQLENLTEYEN
jgi:hypothetical protein